MKFARVSLLALIVATCFSGFASAAPLDAIATDFRVRVGDDLAWAARDADDSNWTRSAPWAADPGGRILWLRAHVDTPARFDAWRRPVAVHVMAAASWELFWNGVLVGRNGTPGASREAEIPGRIKAEVFVPPDLVRDRDNVLALRISSQHLDAPLSAPIQYIGVGTYGGGTEETLRARALPLLATGPLLLGAVYFAVMFLLDRSDRASLLLSLLAVCVLAQLLVESLRGFYAYPYPLHVPRLQAILALAVLSSLLLVAYVTRRYARTWFWPAIGLALALCLASSAFVPGYDGKTTVALLCGLLVALTAGIAGWHSAIAGARITTLALVAVLLVLILGVGQFLDVGWYAAATGLLLFLFAWQAVELRRSQRAGSAAALRNMQLELELLKQKIQPHFLMNTLTALSEWVETSPATGVKMIDALAAELRAVAAMSGRPLVPLSEELDLCRQHLAVMGFRGDRRYELIETGVDADATLPPAVLHTLIENALTHNRYASGAIFALEAHREAQRWIYRLRSPREGTEGGAGDGTGHDYVRGRLRAAYGAGAAFHSGPASSVEWEDVIVVPIEIAS